MPPAGRVLSFGGGSAQDRRFGIPARQPHAQHRREVGRPATTIAELGGIKVPGVDARADRARSNRKFQVEQGLSAFGREALADSGVLFRGQPGRGH